jgi:hypothetical protein
VYYIGDDQECADLRESAERVLWRDGRGIAQRGVAHLRALGTASKDTSVRLVHGIVSEQSVTEVEFPIGT